MYFPFPFPFPNPFSCVFTKYENSVMQRNKLLEKWMLSFLTPK